MKKILLSLVMMFFTSICFAQDVIDKKDIVTKETATKFSDDKTLLDMYNDRNKKIVTPEMLYKKGKRMKVAGYTIGGTLLVAGIVSVIIGATQDKYENLHVEHNSIYMDYNHARDLFLYIGYGAMAGGVAAGVPLILKGSSLQKKNAPHVQAVSAISHDINFKNGSSLNLGLDVLSSNLSFNKTPGIGVRYNF